MKENHSEPLIELKIDAEPETIKKIKNPRRRSKSAPAIFFSANHTPSVKSSNSKPEDGGYLISALAKNATKVKKEKDEGSTKKVKKKNTDNTKMLFQLISQNEADIYADEAMLNLGFVNSDLEYPTKEEIQSFTNNQNLIDLVKKELYWEVDERKKKFEIEKRKIYLAMHLKCNSAYLIHHKMSKKKNSKRSPIYDEASEVDMDDLDLTYGNGYSCDTNFQRTVNQNEDRIRRVVSQHKKIVTKAVFDSLKTHYQCGKSKDASERYYETMNKTQNSTKQINEKSKTRYEKVKKERKIELDSKKKKMTEKFKKDDAKLQKVYNERLNKAYTTRLKNEEKAQRAAEVREEIMLKSIEEFPLKSCSSRTSTGSSSSSVSASALVPQKHQNSGDQISTQKVPIKKKDEIDLELHPEEPFSGPRLLQMMAMNNIYAREARLYGRLAEIEESREQKRIESQQKFEQKQKHISEIRKQQQNDRLSIQKRYQEREKRTEQRIDAISGEYRKFLIKRSAEEAATAERLKKMRKDDLRARRRKAEEMATKEKLREISHNEMKQVKIDQFEEKRLMEDLRQTRAQKERKIFERKEDARKKSRERKFCRNQEERKMLLQFESQYLREYESKMDGHIAEFEAKFSNQMEVAKTDPVMLKKLAEMYNVDIEEVDQKAQKARNNVLPLNDYVESLKDSQNDVDIRTAKEIIFKTTHVKIGPSEDGSESGYLYSDYNSSIENENE